MPPRKRTSTSGAAEHADEDEHAERNGAHASAELHLPAEDTDGKLARDGRGGAARAELRIPLPGLNRLDGQRLLWWGGLGALATIGILDWPVALVVGAGTVIAARASGTDHTTDRQTAIANPVNTPRA